MAKLLYCKPILQIARELSTRVSWFFHHWSYISIIQKRNIPWLILKLWKFDLWCKLCNLKTFRWTPSLYEKEKSLFWFYIIKSLIRFKNIEMQIFTASHLLLHRGQHCNISIHPYLLFMRQTWEGWSAHYVSYLGWSQQCTYCEETISFYLHQFHVEFVK